jgi:hypothetical protein
VQRTGTRLAAIAGLDLGFRLLGEPRCRDLARALGPARYGTLARLLEVIEASVPQIGGASARTEKPR